MFKEGLRQNLCVPLTEFKRTCKQSAAQKLHSSCFICMCYLIYHRSPPSRYIRGGVKKLLICCPKSFYDTLNSRLQGSYFKKWFEICIDGLSFWLVRIAREVSHVASV